MIPLFQLGHYPVTLAIPSPCTFVFHIEITTFKLSKTCLKCSNRWSVFTIMILQANDDFPKPFSFEEIRKSNVHLKCSFSHTNVDMIIERYNTDAIFWRTQFLCVCRLISSEQTDIVSNSHAAYYSVKSSLRITGKDL
jgi:hypothetical protein